MDRGSRSRRGHCATRLPPCSRSPGGKKREAKHVPGNPTPPVRFSRFSCPSPSLFLALVALARAPRDEAVTAATCSASSGSPVSALPSPLRAAGEQAGVENFSGRTGAKRKIEQHGARGKRVMKGRDSPLVHEEVSRVSGLLGVLPLRHSIFRACIACAAYGGSWLMARRLPRVARNFYARRDR